MEEIERLRRSKKDPGRQAELEAKLRDEMHYVKMSREDFVKSLECLKDAKEQKKLLDSLNQHNTEEKDKAGAFAEEMAKKHQTIHQPLILLKRSKRRSQKEA